MTREEAIDLVVHGEWIYSLQVGNKEMQNLIEAISIIDTALRPISRGQAEKVWRGEWIKKDGYTECSKCEYWYDSSENEDDGDRPVFCPSCGAPMTDEAVEIVMERLEALK